MEFSQERPQRQMYQGDWVCSQCGGKITELPFNPDPGRLGQLLCRDCHRQKVGRFRRGGFGGRDRMAA